MSTHPVGSTSDVVCYPRASGGRQTEHGQCSRCLFAPFQLSLTRHDRHDRSSRTNLPASPQEDMRQKNAQKNVHLHSILVNRTSETSFLGTYFPNVFLSTLLVRMRANIRWKCCNYPYMSRRNRYFSYLLRDMEHLYVLKPLSAVWSFSLREVSLNWVREVS